MPISETAHEFLDALDSHDMVAIEAFLTDDFQLSGNVTQPLTKQGMLALLRAYFDAFSDFNFNFAGAAEENKVLHLKFAITSTHDGPLDLEQVGIPLKVEPTKKTASLPESSMDIKFNDQDQVSSITMNQAQGAAMTDLVAQLGAELPSTGVG